MKIKSIFSVLLISGSALMSVNCSHSDKSDKKEAAADSVDFHSWAPTPPMGWNSWDCYGPTVVESEVKANADYMADKLKKFGWQYIIVDIRWYVNNDKAHGYNEKDPVYVMDEYGRFLPSPERFPSSKDGKGFKPLADYVHDKGLKFGIHLMRGIAVEAVKRNTPILGTNYKASDIYSTDLQCRWLHDMYTVDAKKPGAQEYYNSLFKLYADWGLDYVKIDDLSIPYHTGEIEMIRKAIDGCGREIVLSTSPGETPIANADHIKEHANLWRIVGDFWDNWPQIKEHFEVCDRWSPYIGTGHWPDADMLPLGRIGIRAERGDNRMCQLSQDEQITIMSLFSIFKSPLMFGGDLPSNDDFTLSLLTNEEVMDVNQHSTNNKQLFRNDDLIAWTATDPKNDDKFLAVFNASDQKFVNEKKAIWKSEVVTRNTPEHSVAVDVALSGAKKLYLVATVGDVAYDNHNSDWIDPVLKGPKGELSLTKLKWKKVTASKEQPVVNKSLSGGSLKFDGKAYEKGVATYANSIIEYEIPAGYDHFTAKAGIDDEAFKPGVFGIKVRFMVFTEDPTALPPTETSHVPVSFKEMGLEGKYTVRDLWAKKDLGVFENEFSPEIKRHASGLYRLTKQK